MLGSRRVSAPAPQRRLLPLAWLFSLGKGSMGPHGANTGIGSDFFILDSRRVLAPAPKVPGSDIKTHLHTPKAVTYHEQFHCCRFAIGHSLGRMESIFCTILILYNCIRLARGRGGGVHVPERFARYGGSQASGRNVVHTGRGGRAPDRAIGAWC